MREENPMLSCPRKRASTPSDERLWSVWTLAFARMMDQSPTIKRFVMKKNPATQTDSSIATTATMPMTVEASTGPRPVRTAADRQEARKRLLEHLAKQPCVKGEPWTRDELYD